MEVQVPREAGEGETGTVERLAWAMPGAASAAIPDYGINRLEIAASLRSSQ